MALVLAEIAGTRPRRSTGTSATQLMRVADEPILDRSPRGGP
jgi:dTDP-glucose pyrophosphorylase